MFVKFFGWCHFSLKWMLHYSHYLEWKYRCHTSYWESYSILQYEKCWTWLLFCKGEGLKWPGASQLCACLISVSWHINQTSHKKVFLHLRKKLGVMYFLDMHVSISTIILSLPNSAFTNSSLDPCEAHSYKN